MTLSREEQQQYSRHVLLDEIGISGQLLLKTAKVIVIGAGGLGCPVLQYLAAAGVGTLGIIDNDVVEQSNLQRQILFTQSDIGKNKATTAAKRLQALNPFVRFEIYEERLTKEIVIDLFEKYDIIVDGTDNFPSRYLINDAAVLCNKTLVFGSIFQFKGQVTVFNYQNGPTYRCLYPTPPAPETVANCSEVGVLGVLPGIIGCLQANEVLKIILGIGKVLTGKLLTFDALSLQQNLIYFQRIENAVLSFLAEDYHDFCGLEKQIDVITWEDFKLKSDQFNVLDVRNIQERLVFSIASIHIPLTDLELRWIELPEDKSLLLICNSGVRSEEAMKVLRKKGFKQKLFSLKGGLISRPSI